jgi:hypothetical protein
VLGFEGFRARGVVHIRRTSRALLQEVVWIGRGSTRFTRVGEGATRWWSGTSALTPGHPTNNTLALRSLPSHCTRSLSVHGAALLHRVLGTLESQEQRPARASKASVRMVESSGLLDECNTHRCCVSTPHTRIWRSYILGSSAVSAAASAIDALCRTRAGGGQRRCDTLCDAVLVCALGYREGAKLRLLLSDGRRARRR